MEMCPGIFTSSYSWNKLICKTKVEYIVLWVLICVNLIPVIFLILYSDFVSAWKSFVLNIRNSLSSSAKYSKLESFVESRISHIHSSHSSIGNNVGDVNARYTPVICWLSALKILLR